MSVSRKSKKTPSRKKKAKKAATSGPPAPPREVVLSADDGQTVAQANQALIHSQAELGALREQYLASERAQMERIGQARENFTAVLRTLAQKHGVDLDTQKWTFDLSTNTFKEGLPRG